MDCIFCKIIDGTIPSSKIYEDEHMLAFMDISPIEHGHALVIPKVHCRNVFDTPESIAERIYPAVVKVSNAIRKAFKADGVNIMQSNEPAAGQEVFHSHIHIIPRHIGDGTVQLPTRLKVEIAQIVKDAEKIRASF